MRLPAVGAVEYVIEPSVFIIMVEQEKRCKQEESIGMLNNTCCLPCHQPGYLFICFFVNRSPFRTHSRTHGFVDGLCVDHRSLVGGLEWRNWKWVALLPSQKLFCCCSLQVNLYTIASDYRKTNSHELSTRSELIFFAPQNDSLFPSCSTDFNWIYCSLPWCVLQNPSFQLNSSGYVCNICGYSRCGDKMCRLADVELALIIWIARAQSLSWRVHC